MSPKILRFLTFVHRRSPGSFLDSYPESTCHCTLATTIIIPRHSLQRYCNLQEFIHERSPGSFLDSYPESTVLLRACNEDYRSPRGPEETVGCGVSVRDTVVVVTVGVLAWISYKEPDSLLVAVNVA